MYLLSSFLFVFTINMFGKAVCGDLHSVTTDQVIGECNTTYPVVREFIFTHDLDQMIELLKGNKNGKCFLHCFLNKMNVVDLKGNIKKQELSKNINKIMSSVQQQEIGEFKITEVIETYINQCEQSVIVEDEKDTCEKVYKFLSCFKDTE